ncbi:MULTISPECIES: ABC-F family ATP-binding cassette domain-containing protein [unclassified Nonomuraea]|uniref:ABC-F family ATP-binding cassette domain-containing protein n=1 Tax=unclassified Nonomuraea TaxID=2593643 RepID=UPI0033FD12D8
MLTDVSLSVGPGERVAVVGENGSGKSTLLRLLAGVEQPDDGEITVTGGEGGVPGGVPGEVTGDVTGGVTADVTGDVGHLGQTLDLPPGHTVQQAVDHALAGLRAMERRLRELESALTDDVMGEYGELLTAYEARGGYQADARIDKALHGLGLAHVARDRMLSSLSGGERARLGLACVLAADPATLLLDEPTNHLDEPALTWLEERLRGHRGPVVVVSHDRVFLDRVATAVLEVEEGAVTRFGGGYSGYLTAKAAARARWEQAYTAWREEVRQVREHAATTAHRVAAGRAMKDNNKMAYDRNAGRVQSSVAARVRNAHERLRRLEDDPVPRPPAPLRFRAAFRTPAPAGDGPMNDSPVNDSPVNDGPVNDSPVNYGPMSDGPATPAALVELRDVHVGDRLHVGSLTVRPGERVLVSGPNGAGKSTLLRVLAERAGCRAGHLAQDDDLDPGLAVLAAFGHDGYADERRAALLDTGLFPAHVLGRRVGELSVGQRRRLSLARLLIGEHDLLLLDEPTNHLSPVLADELDHTLAAYRGAVVMVTHDRALRRRFTGTEIRLTGGHIC